jgi:hypothetical protein
MTEFVSKSMEAMLVIFYTVLGSGLWLGAGLVSGVE